MNLIVLVKEVPNLDREIKFKEDYTLDRENLEDPILNPYDQNAVRAALDLKGDGKVTAISMGHSDLALKKAREYGAVDELVLLNDERFAGADAVATSYILSQAIKKVGDYDLILCGMNTVEDETGQVGPRVAEFLGLPQLTYVEEINIKENKTLEVRCILEGGYKRVKSTYPAVITTTNTLNEPGYPKMKDVMKSKKAAIETWKAEDIEVDLEKINSLIKVLDVSKPETKKVECQIIETGEDLVKGLKEGRVI